MGWAFVIHEWKHQKNKQFRIYHPVSAVFLINSLSMVILINSLPMVILT